MVNPALLLSTATATSLLTGIDWLVIAIYFCVLLSVAWGGAQSKRLGRGLLLAGRQSELVDHWRLNLCLEHRFLGRQQYLLPILQRVDHPGVGCGHGGV